MALCNLSTIHDETSGYLTNILKTLQKHVDINDGKLSNFFYKYNLIKNSYGLDRRHCQKDWNEQSGAIRAKIQQAILDMPEHDEIKRLLDSSYLDYFCCLKIVEILKETEKESNNMLGMYLSQRMKDWRIIISNYKKNSVYLVLFYLKKKRIKFVC
ncbi:unnamed protein product [Rotaria sp. Silwood2]|nr:unnamed protein product [Rotaria sp. Silwood2]